MVLRNFYQSLSRKKPMVVGESQLSKCLSTLDLTAMGIGCTLGVGVYVLAGEVSKLTAGPGVVISFLIAAFASLLAGLCYAEFGARVPKAGSAYIYCYVSIGEFIAFVIGWNLILEYAIGSASIVKGISNYIDAIVDNKISAFLVDIFPIHIKGLNDYADFFAFGIIIVITIALAFGAKESAFIINMLTFVKLGVVLFVIIAGATKINFKNWQLTPQEVPAGFGDGGFLPYGFGGVIKGAAICFYGFIGFDVIAAAGEETRNPKRSIPLSVCLSLFVIFLAYFGISSVLTLMWPYYDLDENAPLSFIFKAFEWDVASAIVNFGAIFGLFASLLGAMFPLPRVIYAIASDGLLFEIFAKVHPRFKTPFWGTIIAGFLTATLSTFFNLSQLVSMISIGTLMAYGTVAACVLLLKYETDTISEDTIIDYRQSLFKKLFNTDKVSEPTLFTSNLATILVTFYVFLCIVFGLVVTRMISGLENSEALPITLLVIIVVLIMITLIMLYRQPISKKELHFRVPFTPWIPALSMLINIYLMLQLDYMSWIRFGVWLIIGLLIYFIYGTRHSKQRGREQQLIDSSIDESVSELN